MTKNKGWSLHIQNQVGINKKNGKVHICILGRYQNKIKSKSGRLDSNNSVHSDYYIRKHEETIASWKMILLPFTLNSKNMMTNPHNQALQKIKIKPTNLEWM